MGEVGSRCRENVYRPECGHLTPMNNSPPVCASLGPCHKLTEQEIEDGLAYIRRNSRTTRKGLAVSTDTLHFLLQVIDGLKEKNRALEAKVFNGFDVHGQTNYQGLRSDLLEEMDNNESPIGGNEELLSLIRKWKV